MLLSNIHTSRNPMATIRYSQANATSKHQSHLLSVEEGKRDRAVPTLSSAPRACLAWQAEAG